MRNPVLHRYKGRTRGKEEMPADSETTLSLRLRRRAGKPRPGEGDGWDRTAAGSQGSAPQWDSAHTLPRHMGQEKSQALPVSALVTMVLHLLRPPFLCASRAAVLNPWVRTPLGVAYQIITLQFI